MPNLYKHLLKKCKSRARNSRGMLTCDFFGLNTFVNIGFKIQDLQILSEFLKEVRQMFANVLDDQIWDRRLYYCEELQQNKCIRRAIQPLIMLLGSFYLRYNVIYSDFFLIFCLYLCYNYKTSIQEYQMSNVL